MKKNILLAISLFIVIIVTVLFVIINLFVGDNEEIDFSSANGKLYYKIDIDAFRYISQYGDFFVLSDEIELKDQDVEDIYDVFKEYDLKRNIQYNLDCDAYKYVVYFGKEELYFDVEDGVVFIDEDGNRYHATDKKLNKKLDKVFRNIEDDKEDVYIFNLSRVMSTIERVSKYIPAYQIDDIRGLLKDVEKLPEPNNLAISLDYLFVIDDTYIYFDDFDGLAMMGNDMVKLPDKLVELFYNYLYAEVELAQNADGYGVTHIVIDIPFLDKKKIFEEWNYININKEILRSNVSNEEYKSEYFRYLFIVNMSNHYSEVYFDPDKDYVLYDNMHIVIPSKFKSYLLDLVNKYKKTESPQFSTGGDCCSCCPDLKPGEVCIDACCVCSH